MSGKKSKRLGKGFEYEVRDILREATGIQSFERVPTSGAWIGGKNAYKAEYGRDDVIEIMSGDLICPENWRWLVECKNHEGVPYHQLFLGKSSEKINEFLEQTYFSANVAKKEPLLVMKLRKKGYKLPTRTANILKENNIAIPNSNSITLGILVAEIIEFSNEISHLNHIQYTIMMADGKEIGWRFFDMQNWLQLINTRQFKFKNN